MLLIAVGSLTAADEPLPKVRRSEKIRLVPVECRDIVVARPADVAAGQETERATRPVTPRRPAMADAAPDVVTLRPQVINKLAESLTALQVSSKQRQYSRFEEALRVARAEVKAAPDGASRRSAADLLEVYSDLDAVWNFSVNDPSGSFFGTDSPPGLYDRIARRYPSFPAAIREQSVTVGGRTLYPSSETRTFLTREADRRFSQLNLSRRSVPELAPRVVPSPSSTAAPAPTVKPAPPVPPASQKPRLSVQKPASSTRPLPPPVVTVDTRRKPPTAAGAASSVSKKATATTTRTKSDRAVRSAPRGRDSSTETTPRSVTAAKPAPPRSDSSTVSTRPAAKPVIAVKPKVAAKPTVTAKPIVTAKPTMAVKPAPKTVSVPPITSPAASPETSVSESQKVAASEVKPGEPGKTPETGTVTQTVSSTTSTTSSTSGDTFLNQIDDILGKDEKPRSGLTRVQKIWLAIAGVVALLALALIMRALRSQPETARVSLKGMDPAKPVTPLKPAPPTSVAPSKPSPESKDLSKTNPNIQPSASADPDAPTVDPETKKWLENLNRNNKK